MLKSTKPRRTWKYSREFKLKAIKLSLQPDIYIKDVAQRLDIHPFMLSRWRKEYREGLYERINQKSLAIMKQQNKAKPNKPSEIEKLRQENERMKMENDLLKKWQRYLAEEQPLPWTLNFTVVGCLSGVLPVGHAMSPAVRCYTQKRVFHYGSRTKACRLCAK